MKLKLWVFLLFVSAALAGCGGADVPQSEMAIFPTTGAAPTPTSVSDGVLLGFYPGAYLKTRVNELVQIDAWMAPTGKRVSIAATFFDLEDPDLIRSVPAEMQAL